MRSVLAILVLAAVSVEARPRFTQSSLLYKRQASNTVSKDGCVAHADHYDCEDGGFCELEGSTWVCFDVSGKRQNADGSEIDTEQNNDEGGQSVSNDECVVHGGHTHGSCGELCSGIDTGHYDLHLHIASIFVLLVASAFGTVLPVLLKRSQHTFTLNGTLFDVLRHFSTGVILATALVHLLYHSFIMFNNECVGSLAFEPAAPAIALAALLTTFLVDFVAMKWLKRNAAIEPTGKKFVEGHTHEAAEFDTGIDYSSRQAHVDVYILEAGIVFHSIMIGVSLGATGGNEWISLLCAIVFHQFFEGTALGSRIALLVFAKHSTLRKFLMGLAFSLITPVGIAIGVAVHSSYNVNGKAAVLSIGILDALSAGILLYIGLHLLVHDWIHGEMARKKSFQCFLNLLALFTGLLLMTLLGNWA